MVSFSMTLSDPNNKPNPGFKVTVYLQVEYLKKRCVLGTKLLKNTNRTIHDLPNDTTFNDLE